MRVLLDECLPRKLIPLLAGHQAVTVTQSGWSGIKNGELLRLAQSAFDVFLTVDQNLEAQQNLSKFDIGVLVVCSESNQLEHLFPFVPRIIEALREGPFRGAKYVRA